MTQEQLSKAIEVSQKIGDLQYEKEKIDDFLNKSDSISSVNELIRRIWVSHKQNEPWIEELKKAVVKCVSKHREEVVKRIEEAENELRNI